MAVIVTEAHVVGKLGRDWWRLEHVISLSSEQQGFVFPQINSLSQS